MDKITAIYMRAIIDDDDGYLSEEQRILEDYAESHGLINTQFFCDIGYSADDQNRPEYNRMMAAVNGDEIGIILTYDSAKLCGSLVALYDTMNHMRKKGVRVIFLHDNARILVNDIHDQGIGWNSHIINRYNLPELSDWEYEKKNGDAIGFQGRIHQQFLMDYRPAFYTSLVLSGKLFDYLHHIDEISNIRADCMLDQMILKENLTVSDIEERLSDTDPRKVLLQTMIEYIIRDELHFG